MAAYAALVSLMHIIDNLGLHPRPPISLRKKQAESLTAKVTFLQRFLEGYNPHLDYSKEADPLESRIADAAYAAEDVIESHIVHSITNDGKKITTVGLYKGLKKVIQEMTLIEKEAMKIKETGVEVQHQLHTKSTPTDSFGSSSPIAQKSSMVGADDLLLEMKAKLTDNRLDLQVIPIVGMGGTGKTTLATNLYQDLLIKEHFDICAWTTISQEYNIREILIQVLKQLIILEDSQDLSEGEVGEMLHKHLYGKKYMLIVDDLWNIEAWDEIKWFLPNNTNGSKIVVTTRLSNLASKFPNSNHLEMKLLDEAHSWDLLSKIVFGERGCPIELEEVGKKIGRSCKGLPLSIVVVGGFLTKSSPTIEVWEYIEENLNSVVNLEEDEHCLKILYMSYKQLPVYLKPCFLYMGVFPEDKEIRISKIIRLWVVEGFLKPVNGKKLDDIAKEYLEDLIGRNLVMIHELGSIGNIKQCKVHDLVRDFCLRKAEKEKFYTVLASGPSPQGSVNTSQRRIVVSSTTSTYEAINALSSMPLVRSLIWNLEYEDLTSLNLRLLRVLEAFSSINTATDEFMESMHQLVNLRYLNVWLPRVYDFPSSVFWLFWNLQALYLDLMGSSAPVYLWCMPHVTHLQLYWIDLPTPDHNDQNVLGNMLSLGNVRDFRCSQQVIENIINVRKLKIFYTAGFSDDRYCLNNLTSLHKLESLKCSFYKYEVESVPEVLHSLISFPHQLKKLSIELNKSQYWEEILDNIGALPLLQKLKLLGGSFKEGKWETNEGQFRSLKFLALCRCLDLQVWRSESSHFPRLEKLLLDNINELTIPLDFAEISTLQVIELEECTDCVVSSAKRIIEEQEEFYGEETTLQVLVRCSKYKY